MPSKVGPQRSNLNTLPNRRCAPLRRGAGILCHRTPSVPSPLGSVPRDERRWNTLSQRLLGTLPTQIMRSVVGRGCETRTEWSHDATLCHDVVHAMGGYKTKYARWSPQFWFQKISIIFHKMKIPFVPKLIWKKTTQSFQNSVRNCTYYQIQVIFS